MHHLYAVRQTFLHSLPILQSIKQVFSSPFLLQVYDVPTITGNVSTSDVQHVGSALVADEADDDVYSVPTLPGLPLGPGESTTSLSGENTAQVGQVYSVPGPEKRASGGDNPGDPSEPDCGIYDMPALTIDALPHSSSSSSTSTRRLSVSSNGSGDVQWRASLSGLVHSVLSAASCPASTLLSRDLATSLAEILSVWKASHTGDPPPPLQQAWARLSDLLPALSAIGNAPPSEGLLTLVQRALEESSLLLQAQGRPRLPSQESLSRRPLPALPGTDGKTSGSGMGSRKGSWIQERPLPPTPQPTFPLPPSTSSVTLTVGPSEGEEDPSNEYAGIGLTPTPAPLPAGDSVGYVKLQVSHQDGVRLFYALHVLENMENQYVYRGLYQHLYQVIRKKSQTLLSHNQPNIIIKNKICCSNYPYFYFVMYTATQY